MSIDRQAQRVCCLAENGRLFTIVLIPAAAVVADADFICSLFSLQPPLPTAM